MATLTPAKMSLQNAQLHKRNSFSPVSRVKMLQLVGINKELKYRMEKYTDNVRRLTFTLELVLQIAGKK